MRNLVLGFVLAAAAAISTPSNAGELLPDFLPLEKLPLTRSEAAKLRDLDRHFSRDVKTAGSEWDDIKGWRALGGRWAAALDAQGAIIAIYDLSITRNGPLAVVQLATIGGPGFTLDTVRETLEGKNSPDAEKAL